MKTLLNAKTTPRAVLALGAVGFALRKLLYLIALDGKNLLLRGTPLELGLWLVTGAALVLAVLGAKKAEESELDCPVFAFKGQESLGCLVLALGIAATVVSDGMPGNGLETARFLLGSASAATLILGVVYQRKGQAPFVPYALVCVYFAVHMVGCYRMWSGNPQLQDYVFTLFACVALMLQAYQQGAWAAGCGSPRVLRFAGMAAVFFCMVCLSGTEDTVLYFTGGIWAVTHQAAPRQMPVEETDDGTA